MPDPLRTKFAALVEEWRFFTSIRCETERLRLEHCADQLAAILAESEPEEPQDNAHQLAARLRACGRDDSGGCGRSGCPDCFPEAKAKKRPCPGCDGGCESCRSLPPAESTGPCEAKAKHPKCGQFHESHEAFMGGTRPYPGQTHCSLCGQPLSAHEPK